MAAFNEKRHTGGFLLNEAVGHLSFENGVLLSGQNLEAGTVVGKITTVVTAPTSAAVAGNTGNGTMGAVTVSAGVLQGVYTLEVVTAAANGGFFEVRDPQGDVVGTGNVAVAFSAGGMAFTLADGATDFVSGDSFTITVAAGSNKFAQVDASASNGRQFAAAILYANTDASAGDVACTFIVRDAEVNGHEIIWPASAPQLDLAAGVAALAAQHVIVRN